MFDPLFCHETSFEYIQIATHRTFSTAKAIEPTLKNVAVLVSEIVLQQHQLQINIHQKTGTLLLLFQGMI